MDKPPASAPKRVKPAIELDDQTKRAAILEIARRLELVREQTGTRREPRRPQRKADDDVMSGFGVRKRNDAPEWVRWGGG
jgi:hypothetical protein